MDMHKLHAIAILLPPLSQAHVNASQRADPPIEADVATSPNASSRLNASIDELAFLKFYRKENTI